MSNGSIFTGEQHVTYGNSCTALLFWCHSHVSSINWQETKRPWLLQSVMPWTMIKGHFCFLLWRSWRSHPMPTAFKMSEPYFICRACHKCGQLCNNACLVVYQLKPLERFFPWLSLIQQQLSCRWALGMTSMSMNCKTYPHLPQNSIHWECLHVSFIWNMAVICPEVEVDTHMAIRLQLHCLYDAKARQHRTKL